MLLVSGNFPFSFSVTKVLNIRFKDIASTVAAKSVSNSSVSRFSDSSSIFPLFTTQSNNGVAQKYLSPVTKGPFLQLYSSFC